MNDLTGKIIADSLKALGETVLSQQREINELKLTKAADPKPEDGKKKLAENEMSPAMKDLIADRKKTAGTMSPAMQERIADRAAAKGKQ